ncbi:MAG: hydantoinase/carbamoylase family amidase [Pseudomonadota bacterium]
MTIDQEDQPLATAHRLFAELAEATADPPGITRDSFGKGEAVAHAMIRREAERLGLEIRIDDIGHFYVSLPGRDRNAPVLMIGSHIDSVRHGGNYDGAAGVLAGLALLEWLTLRNITPAFDVTLMVLRAEEMVWFPAHYLGSRAAFGLLPRGMTDSVRRSDSGRTLGEHMADQGFDPSAIREARPQLDPKKIRAFIEPHIEQGPVLRRRGKAVGIVTAIRGNIRYRFPRIIGETTHAGGVPRADRKDAVLAGAELVAAMEGWWLAFEEAGRDFVLTIGEFATNPDRHAITKVPGELAFTIDARSVDPDVLADFDERLHAKVREIETRRGVTIDLGEATRADAALMDEHLRQGLHLAAERAGVEVVDIASGGGHDCAVFCWQGVPSAMIFIANDHGSHNPDENMEMVDFDAAWRVLAAYVEGVIQDV